MSSLFCKATEFSRHSGAWLVCVVFLLLFAGCTDKHPPPAPPRPDKQATKQGLQLAEKMLVAVKAKDKSRVDEVAREVQKHLEIAMKKADGDMEEDFGRLFIVTTLVDQNDWAGADETLTNIINNTTGKAKAAK